MHSVRAVVGLACDTRLAPGPPTQVLLGALRQLEVEDTEAVVQLLAAVRQLAANDEICRDFCDSGGVAECLKLLSAGAGLAQQERAAFGALRQLANSDVVKSTLADAGALDAIVR